MAWKVVDGKLYLNLSHSIAKLWMKDIPGYIAKADKNWPTLVDISTPRYAIAEPVLYN